MARRRDERIDHAVLAAVSELLREVGYSALTMEAVAARAGTTKPAIRRRWKSQQHLVVAAMAHERVGVVEIDTGCLHCDIVGHLEALRVGMADPALSRVIPALLADLANDRQLHEEFLAIFWEPRRDACVVSLRRAQERGEIAQLDIDLLLDLFAAPIVFRALFRHAELGPDFAELVTRAVLAGVGDTRRSSCTHPVG
ncbi:TetR/AcrR family transcriptional regulator [Streptomyces rugosispiralis]|uniref:TetR/AcrR family transcriptional regulator n=1 Tax=Streptomyces rugosispiralis TaxID=2967341 RepID=A0ABT1V640_9ACTN|nr:TetR/AcrR family transcriptional regulator [Streptomyces rugosispiralis]MCQ8192001.1 TetR/AcrR family transcriptional regulator [Streptomyces rugosispiralis]